MNTPEVFEKTRMFAQIKDYFIYKLTGCYYTDHSTTSDHGYFDISNRCYWEEMLTLTGIRYSRDERKGRRRVLRN